jgi:HEAT repeat protein
MKAGKAVDKLIEKLSDENSFVQGSAAGALGEMKAGKAVDKLIEKLSDENSSVRGSAAGALGSIGKSSDEVIKALSFSLNDKDLYVRANAFKSIELLAGGEYS